MKKRAEVISKSSDIGHMLTIADFGLFLDVSLELCITVTIEQPLEDNFLHLLVVRLLKEVIMETRMLKNFIEPMTKSFPLRELL